MPNTTISGKAATYLVRFDDICQTMNWATWDRIEEVLVTHEIRPILTVVPDNKDPNLIVGPSANDFWERVRKWQARKWSIALHGYQHRYVNTNSGMLKLATKSEFAGLSRQAQEFKLREGLAKFAAEGVQADAWAAPSHSFDETTVELLSELGIRVISDGFSLFPFQCKNGLTWVPQQLWNFRPRKCGVWTICFHSNEWNETKCDQFGAEVKAFRPQISNLAEVVSRWHGRAPNMRDWLNASLTTLRLGIGARLSAKLRPARNGNSKL